MLIFAYIKTRLIYYLGGIYSFVLQSENIPVICAESMTKDKMK